MTESLLSAPATHLLSIPDAHGDRLADFTYYPAHDLLCVDWHGHLTAEAIVRGAKAGMHLFESRPLPHRLLSNHQQVTGEWGEALPWLHYEWLPKAAEGGIQVLAHVLAHNTASRLINFPGGHEFIAAVTHELRAVSFRHLEPAWHWVTSR